VTFDQATSLLREFGFPVVVALWFMLRLEKRLDRLAELMASFMSSMTLLAKGIDYHFTAPRLENGEQGVSGQDEEVHDER